MTNLRRNALTVKPSSVLSGESIIVSFLLFKVVPRPKPESERPFVLQVESVGRSFARDGMYRSPALLSF